MATDSTLVAFIIGAGSHIGAAVAAKLHGQGYKVALGNRHPAESENKADYLHVQVDASNRESIEAAFDTVTKALGPVNVVVFNGASNVYLTEDLVRLRILIFYSCFSECPS